MLVISVFISGFVEYPPNPVASCEFQPFSFKNQACTAVYVFMENLFVKDFPGLCTTYSDYIESRASNMLSEIVRSSFTGRGDPSELCS